MRTEMRTDRVYRCMRAPNPLAAFEEEISFEEKRADPTWLSFMMRQVCRVIVLTVPPVDTEALVGALLDLSKITIYWAESLNPEADETDLVE